MRTPTRLTHVALLTAGLYLSAALWCAAPARAADPPGLTGDPRDRDVTGSAYPHPLTTGMPDAAPQEEPVDAATYVVGPGDLMVLHFWGSQNFSYRLQVDPQGRVLVPNVGFVTAAGLTLAALEKTLTARLKATYPRLKNGLSLLKPRSFVVHVAGLVRTPDTYHVTALTRVSRVIKLAGGRTPGGTQTKVEVRRHGQTLVANLQPFYLRGDSSHNPFLLDGDVVYVPPAEMEVTIGGSVYRPGTYELAGDQTLGALVRLAGGLTRDASTTLPVQVVRRGANDQVANLTWPPPLAREAQQRQLRHGDYVTVPSVGELQRRVIVQGAIAAGAKAAQAAGPDRRLDSAGTAAREFTVALPFFDGDTARVVLERAGGLLPWADARHAVVERRDASGKTTRLALDAHALLVLRDLTHDLPLKAGDVVYVPAEREGIMVSGPVYRPGLYQHSPSYKALDYVALAGGPTPNGSVSGAKVITKSGKNVPIDEVTTLAPGDTVAVKQKFLTTFEWVQILLTISSIALSATAIVISVRK